MKLSRNPFFAIRNMYWHCIVFGINSFYFSSHKFQNAQETVELVEAPIAEFNLSLFWSFQPLLKMQLFLTNLAPLDLIVNLSRNPV